MKTDLPPPLLDGDSTTRLSPFAAVESAPTKQGSGEELLLLPAIKIAKNARDITGQRFGRLIALRPVGRRHSNILWLVRCDCGSHRRVLLTSMFSGNTTSCGCYASEGKRARATIDLAGQRFGRLVALRLTGEMRGSRNEWLCLCDCGEHAKITTHELRSGDTRSCGCLHIECGTSKLAALHAAGTYLGERSPMWNPNLTDEGRAASRLRSRKHTLYTFKRDGFACACCGDARGGNLNAHHMDSWAEHPALREDLDNLITVCNKCHNAYHRLFPGRAATASSFVTWFRAQQEN